MILIIFPPKESYIVIVIQSDTLIRSALCIFVPFPFPCLLEENNYHLYWIYWQRSHNQIRNLQTYWFLMISIIKLSVNFVEGHVNLKMVFIANNHMTTRFYVRLAAVSTSITWHVMHTCMTSLAFKLTRHGESDMTVEKSNTSCSLIE